MQPEVILHKLTQRIREEFEEAPGLRVTVREAARFWDLDEMTTQQVLARLCAAGFLTVDSDNRYRQMAAHGVPCGPAASNA
jgi:DNA-binding IclR family transcriptional regulator